jgi:hypothetical protein
METEMQFTRYNIRHDEERMSKETYDATEEWIRNQLEEKQMMKDFQSTCLFGITEPACYEGADSSTTLTDIMDCINKDNGNNGRKGRYPYHCISFPKLVRRGILRIQCM